MCQNLVRTPESGPTQFPFDLNSEWCTYHTILELRNLGVKNLKSWLLLQSTVFWMLFGVCVWRTQLYKHLLNLWCLLCILLHVVDYRSLPNLIWSVSNWLVLFNSYSEGKVHLDHAHVQIWLVCSDHRQFALLSMFRSSMWLAT